MQKQCYSPRRGIFEEQTDISEYRFQAVPPPIFAMCDTKQNGPWFWHRIPYNYGLGADGHCLHRVSLDDPRCSPSGPHAVRDWI